MSTNRLNPLPTAIHCFHRIVYILAVHQMSEPANAGRLYTTSSNRLSIRVFHQSVSTSPYSANLIVPPTRDQPNNSYHERRSLLQTSTHHRIMNPPASLYLTTTNAFCAIRCPYFSTNPQFPAQLQTAKITNPGIKSMLVIFDALIVQARKQDTLYRMLQLV